MKKRGLSKIWWIVIIIIILIIGGFVYYNYFRSDPANLSPPDAKGITGKASYSENPFTINQLEKGVGLDRGWNEFVWTKEADKEIPIIEAFDSILSNVYYAYNYNNGKYWFNPKGPYARYSNSRWYRSRIFNKIKPGYKYGVYMSKYDTLQYNFGPKLTKIILPDGVERKVQKGEVVCVNYEKIVDRRCAEGESVSNYSNSDFNKDGKVNNKDRIILTSFYKERMNNGLIWSCNETNDYCDGVDINRDKKVSKEDLNKFIEEHKSDCKNSDPDYVNAIKDKINSEPALNCNNRNSFCDVLDTNLDGVLSPLDSLIIIQFVNSC